MAEEQDQPETTPDDEADVREDETHKVLRMVAEGKLTPEQAEEILSLLEEEAHEADEAPSEAASGAFVGMSLEEIERDVIRQTIERCEGDVFQAAQMLRIPLHELYRKLAGGPGEGPRRGGPPPPPEPPRGRRHHRAERARQRAERARQRAERHRRRAVGRRKGEAGSPHFDPIQEAVQRAVEEAVEKSLSREMGKDGLGKFGEELTQKMDQMKDEFQRTFGEGFFQEIFEGREEEIPPKEWDLPSTRRVILEVGEGKLEIEPSEDERVHTRHPRTGERTDELLRLTYEGPANVLLPNECELTATVEEGQIHVRDLAFGEASFRSGEGDIILRGCSGTLHVETDDGGIVLRDGEYTHLDVHSGDGAIEIIGKAASESPVKATTDDGDIEVTLTTSGPIELRSGDGKLRLTYSDEMEEPISLTTDDGGVKVDGPALGPLTVRSGDGAIAINTGRVVGRCELETEDGEIAFHSGDVTSVTMQSGSGLLRANVGSVAETIEMKTDDGEINLSLGTAGSVLIQSGEGDLEANIGDIQGEVRLTTEEGDIRLNVGRAFPLELHSGNGDLEATVGEVAESIVMKTDNGDIRLTIPESLPCTLDLSTDDGEVHCAFPLEETRWTDEGHVAGMRHGDGVSIRLHADRGDVFIRTA